MSIEKIKLSEVDDNAEYNTRTLLGDVSELRDSIAEHGVRTPIIVKPNRAGAEKPYRLIAGFRRVEASRQAGLTDIQADILPQKTTGTQMLVVNLVENVQREGLHPLDEAEAYHKLAKAGMAVSEIAKTVGKSRSYIERRMGLVTLTDVVKTALREDRIGVGAATEISRLPEDLHSKYVVLAEDFATGKLKDKVEKELEKIEARKQPGLPNTPKAKDEAKNERLYQLRDEVLDEFGDLAARYAEAQIPNLHILDLSELEDEATLKLMTELLRAGRRANHPDDDLRKPDRAEPEEEEEEEEESDPLPDDEAPV